ncbi:GNAT family N-acetyltransferase [Rubripirellula lacrimiformis]|nr:GNAT family N-acetyltransferase [Rubripirellula lacrimiformis]
MNPKSSITIRPLRPEDAAACLDLFRDTIHRVCHVDYSAEQRNAWASDQIDSDAWKRRFEDRYSLVACCNGRIEGFTDMTTDGYLDRIFVSADHQRMGIARQMVEALVDYAANACINRVTTESSITAKAFFESQGFQVTQSQSVQCRGVWLDNFKMELRLPKSPT